MRGTETPTVAEAGRRLERIGQSVGIVVLAAAVALLGLYLFISYESRIVPAPVNPRMLTYHDELFSVSFPDANDGWIAGKFGLMLHTADGGKAWHEQITPTTDALSSVSFVDDLHGIAVGGAGRVIATEDGGKTWRLQKSLVDNHLLTVQQISREVAFAVGSYGTLISTHDGGLTWHREALSWRQLIPEVIKDAGYMEPNLSSIFFLDRRSGWIVGEFGLILHTDDGGQTWNTQRCGKSLPQLYAVTFVDPHDGWAVGQLGNMLKTSDGGQNWRPVELGVHADFYGITFDGMRGVIVGDGIAMVSKNGGATWEKLDSISEDIFLSAVAPVGEREVFAVGQAGFMRKFDTSKDAKFNQ